MEAFLNCILCRCSCLRFGLGLCIRCQAVMVFLLASMSFSSCLVFFARSLLGAHSFALWRFLVDSRRPGWTSTSSNLGAGSPPRRRLLAIRPDMAFIPLCLFWKLQVPSGVSFFFPDPLMFSHLSYLRPAKQRRAHRKKSTQVAVLFWITVWSLFTSVEGTRPLHISCTNLWFTIHGRFARVVIAEAAKKHFSIVIWI